MTRADLEFVTIDDFSPGIFTNTRHQGGRGVVGALGAATEENTYRCIAGPTGYLAPAPRRTRDITLPELPNWVGNLKYYITGLNAEMGFVFANSGAETDQRDRVEIHFALVYPNGAGYTVTWYRYRIYDTNSTLEVIHTYTSASGSISEGRRYVNFINTRMNPADPTTIGDIVTVATWVGNPDTAGENWCKAFPDPAADTTNTVIDVGDPAHDYYRIFGHQGRVVMSRYIRYFRGYQTSRTITDNWHWTEPNDNTLASAIPTPFVLESPQGFVDAFSSSANEFLIIKSFGGGIMVRGSLDNPTIIQLPNLHSPDGAQNTIKGCVSPLGPVYCGADGVYLWEGGDKDRKISVQLEETFYHTPTEVVGADGQASRWGDRVLFPNNWMWDSAAGSWWRLEDPADVNVIWWSASAYRAQLYGSGDVVNNEVGAVNKGNRTVMWRWSYDQPCYAYSWQSQPLPNTGNRLLKVRELALSYQGTTQDITVTINNEDGQSVSHTFAAVNSPNLWDRLRVPMHIEGKHLQVRIECDGTVASSHAALIQSLSLGMEPSTHLANVS